MECREELFEERVLVGAWVTGEEGVEHFSRTVSANLASLLAEDAVGGARKALEFGSNLLDRFCRTNWIGPCPDHLNYPIALPHIEKLNILCLEALSWDGEEVYPLTHHPFFLFLSHIILVENIMSADRAVWWALHCLIVQQRILGQRSASLWSKISNLIENDVPRILEGDTLSVVSPKTLREEKCELHLEIGHILLEFSQYETAKIHIVSSSQLLAGLSVELTGALGRRTRFQTTDIAQLTLTVTLLEGAESQGEVKERSERSPSLPKDLQLQDDTLLEHIAFTEDGATPPFPRLSPLQQAVILGQCICLRKSLPVDQLTREETEAYVRCLLSQPQVWSVQSLSLLLRCQLEQQRRRTVERVMMQLEELVQGYHSHKDEHVMQLFYSLPLPPIWKIEKQHADVLVSLGLIQNAMEIYERLEEWEELVECYKMKGRKGMAEKVVRERMEKEKATPTLLCLLGDVTQNTEHYCKAWEMSGGRCGRAQRSLGLYHLRRKEYKECIPALEHALQVNSLQEEVWFSLGCAAMQVGEDEKAAKAFHRCVTLEPNFAEAWNNLAIFHLKKNAKVKAFHSYQQALKCSFDNTKIWENFLTVSTDIDEYSQAISAYHRLLDLHSKFIDVEILRCLVKAVVEGKIERSGNSAMKLRQKLGQLLGRITSQTISNADVWELFSLYHSSSDDRGDREKALLELQKAQRCTRQSSGWDREWAGLERAANLTLKYSQMCREICSGFEVKGQSMQSLTSARMAVQGIISKTKNFGVTPLEQQTQLLWQLEEELQHVVDKLSPLQES